MMNSHSQLLEPEPEASGRLTSGVDSASRLTSHGLPENQKPRQFASWLLKQKDPRSWAVFSPVNRRYFTIDFNHHILYYSHNPDSRRISMPIPFNTMVEVLDGDQGQDAPAEVHAPKRRSTIQKIRHSISTISTSADELKYKITLRLENRTLELYATSPDDKRQWLEAFRLAIEGSTTRCASSLGRDTSPRSPLETPEVSNSDSPAMTAAHTNNDTTNVLQQSTRGTEVLTRDTELLREQAPGTDGALVLGREREAAQQQEEEEEAPPIPSSASFFDAPLEPLRNAANEDEVVIEADEITAINESPFFHAQDLGFDEDDSSDDDARLDEHDGTDSKEHHHHHSSVSSNSDSARAAPLSGLTAQQRLDQQCFSDTASESEGEIGSLWGELEKKADIESSTKEDEYDPWVNKDRGDMPLDTILTTLAVDDADRSCDRRGEERQDDDDVFTLGTKQEESSKKEFPRWDGEVIWEPNTNVVSWMKDLNANSESQKDDDDAVKSLPSLLDDVAFQTPRDVAFRTPRPSPQCEQEAPSPTVFEDKSTAVVSPSRSPFKLPTPPVSVSEQQQVRIGKLGDDERSEKEEPALGGNSVAVDDDGKEASVLSSWDPPETPELRRDISFTTPPPDDGVTTHNEEEQHTRIDKVYGAFGEDLGSPGKSAPMSPVPVLEISLTTPPMDPMGEVSTEVVEKQSEGKVEAMGEEDPEVTRTGPTAHADPVSHVPVLEISLASSPREDSEGWGKESPVSLPLVAGTHGSGKALNDDGVDNAPLFEAVTQFSPASSPESRGQNKRSMSEDSYGSCRGDETELRQEDARSVNSIGRNADGSKPDHINPLVRTADEEIKVEDVRENDGGRQHQVGMLHSSVAESLPEHTPLSREGNGQIGVENIEEDDARTKQEHARGITVACWESDEGSPKGEAGADARRNRVEEEHILGTKSEEEEDTFTSPCVRGNVDPMSHEPEESEGEEIRPSAFVLSPPDGERRFFTSEFHDDEEEDDDTADIWGALKTVVLKKEQEDADAKEMDAMDVEPVREPEHGVHPVTKPPQDEMEDEMDSMMTLRLPTNEGREQVEKPVEEVLPQPLSTPTGSAPTRSRDGLEMAGTALLTDAGAPSRHGLDASSASYERQEAEEKKLTMDAETLDGGEPCSFTTKKKMSLEELIMGQPPLPTSLSLEETQPIPGRDLQLRPVERPILRTSGSDASPLSRASGGEKLPPVQFSPARSSQGGIFLEKGGSGEGTAIGDGEQKTRKSKKSKGEKLESKGDREERRKRREERAEARAASRVLLGDDSTIGASATQTGAADGREERLQRRLERNNSKETAEERKLRRLERKRDRQLSREMEKDDKKHAKMPLDESTAHERPLEHEREKPEELISDLEENVFVEDDGDDFDLC